VRGKVFEASKFSVVETLQAIAEANVCSALDATRASPTGRISLHPRGRRAVVIAVNNGTQSTPTRRKPRRSIEQRLPFLAAPVMNISAKKRQGFGPVWTAIAEAHASATRKMPTPVLTRLLQEAVLHQTPKRAGAFRPKLRYAHQGGMNPPLIVIHGNSLEHVTDAYKRFLEGRFRAHFKLTGTPLRIEMRSSKNPFVEKGR
jgi:GTP-binding protein